MTESYEYRWLLFDSLKGEAFFSPDYDYAGFTTSSAYPYCTISCWGLYCFPARTKYPTYWFGPTGGKHAISAARTWAETEARPMRQAMDRAEWENLVRLTAYFKWIDEGRPEGHHLDHWIAASTELADLLVTEYVYVKFDQPEVPDGTHEASGHGQDTDPQLPDVVSGGPEGPERVPEAGTFTRKLVATLKSVPRVIDQISDKLALGLAPGRLVQPAGQGTGRLIRPAKACCEAEPQEGQGT